jgi:crossover junction endodeoxyribonuclease RuvC
MKIGAVDPGLSGGLAVLDTDDHSLWTEVMPTMGDGKKRIVDAYRVGQYFIQSNRPALVVVEQVSAMPKQGVSSMFKFGMVYGQVLGALQSRMLPIVYVSPRKWKNALNLSSDKKSSFRMANELFPHNRHDFARVTVDEGRAEAALMAHYWSMQNG